MGGEALWGLNGNMEYGNYEYFGTGARLAARDSHFVDVISVCANQHARNRPIALVHASPEMAASDSIPVAKMALENGCIFYSYIVNIILGCLQ